MAARNSVSWSNHLNAAATRQKHEQEEAARLGDPPTERLIETWPHHRRRCALGTFECTRVCFCAVTGISEGVKDRATMIEDDIWDNLLDSIDEGSVLPVVGWGVTTFGPDNQPLAPWLASELATKLGVDNAQLPATPCAQRRGLATSDAISPSAAENFHGPAANSRRSQHSTR
jgi:hypothetical protein